MVTAQDINSRFEETALAVTEQAQTEAEGAKTDTAASAEEKKLLDDTTQTAADAGKTGGASLPEDVAKELEELRAYKKQYSQQAEETPEQKAEREKQYQTQLHTFAFEKGLYNAEDLGKLESLKSQADTDIVYSNFKENFKTINPAATEEEMKDAFNSHYHVDSENEHLKKLGENRLAAEAANYRTPFQSKFDSAQKEFEIQRGIDAKVPEFDNFLKKVIKDHSPENWAVFKAKDGEEEIPVNFQLSETDREAAYKQLRQSDNFALFLKDPKQAEELLQKQAEAIHRLTHNDKINKAIFDSGVSRGTKKGSTTGAENAFPINSQKGATQQADTTAMEELQKSDDVMRSRR